MVFPMKTMVFPMKTIGFPMKTKPPMKSSGIDHWLHLTGPRCRQLPRQQIEDLHGQPKNGSSIFCQPWFYKQTKVVERLNRHTWGAYYSWVDLGMGQNPVQLTSRKRGSDGHHVATWMRTQFRGLLLLTCFCCVVAKCKVVPKTHDYLASIKGTCSCIGMIN